MYDLHKPKIGDRGTYSRLDGSIGNFTISSVDGNLCYAVYDDYPGDKGMPFIWRFNDGLNVLHDWPSKNASARASTDKGEA